MTIQVIIAGFETPEAKRIAQECLKRGLSVSHVGLVTSDDALPSNEEIVPEMGQVSLVNLRANYEGAKSTLGSVVSSIRSEHIIPVVVDVSSPQGNDVLEQLCSELPIPFIITEQGDVESFVSSIEQVSSMYTKYDTAPTSLVKLKQQGGGPAADAKAACFDYARTKALTIQQKMQRILDETNWQVDRIRLARELKSAVKELQEGVDVLTGLKEDEQVPLTREQIEHSLQSQGSAVHRRSQQIRQRYDDVEEENDVSGLLASVFGSSEIEGEDDVCDDEDQVSATNLQSKL